jgi:hypothetical protein
MLENKQKVAMISPRMGVFPDITEPGFGAARMLQSTWHHAKHPIYICAVGYYCCRRNGGPT